MLRKVYDPEGENFCDRCGIKIPKGQIYWAKRDDEEIICEKCANEGEG